jgi:hypothetical protein
MTPDPLRPARGILNGLLLAVIFWLVVVTVYVLLTGAAASASPASCVLSRVAPVALQHDGTGVQTAGLVRGYCPAPWLAKTVFQFQPEYARGANRWHVLGVHYTSGPAGRIDYRESDDDYTGCGYWRIKVRLTTASDRIVATGPTTEFCAGRGEW